LLDAAPVSCQKPPCGAFDEQLGAWRGFDEFPTLA
jgi:hypothetical protein